MINILHSSELKDIKIQQDMTIVITMILLTRQIY